METLYIVYGKDECKFCDAATSLLDSQNLEYTLFKLGEHFSREDLLEKFPNAKTYPQIVKITINVDSGTTREEYIGGYDQLVENQKENYIVG